MTLDQIIRRNALRFPEKDAVIMDDLVYSWARLNERIDKLANALLQCGLGKGDRVAVLASNCIEYIEIYFAIARSGLIVVPVNYRLTPRELAEIINHAEPGLLIVASEFSEQVIELEKLVTGLDKKWIIGDGQLDGAESYEARMEIADASAVYSNADEKDCFAIFYTSGTTGLPKGAMVSHMNLEMNGYNQVIADAATVDDINLVSTPLYHMGAVFMAVSYMLLGCTQVIMSKFEPGGWLKLMQTSKATVSLLIPTMLNAVLNHDEFSKYKLTDLRLIFYGGGPMPAAVLERAIRYLNCGFTQGYGLTETLEATFLTAADHVLDGTAQQMQRLNSAGREAVGADVKIIDDEGGELGPGEVGEILIRSRSVISGYWKMDEESARVIRDGWFHTGDMGYLDEDRYLFVVDRKKDMVISGGVNIYTKEIEGILYQHEAVLEAAVIGLPDEEWGEIVTAIVALRNGASASEDELINYCRETLASYKKPRKIYFMEDLPKNPSGKILKRDLRDLYRNKPA